MGRWFGKRIPDDYNPFWEEKYYQDQPEHWHWWHLGYDDGYQAGYDKGYSDLVRQKNLEGQIESLKALITANQRVSPEFDEYLRKALEEEGRPRSDSVHESEQA